MKVFQFSSRTYALILFLFSLILYFFVVDMPLTDGDTGYYATIARNIVRTGDWQSLYYGNPVPAPGDKLGKDLVDKPPLSIWPIALSYKLFGVSDWSTRAWHSLLAAFSILLTYLTAREAFPPRTSFWAGAVFLTSALMFYAGQVPQQDVPVVFLTTFSLWSFLRLWRTGKTPYFYLIWLGTGLNLLTRGLPGIAFIAGPIFLFLLTYKILGIERARIFSGKAEAAVHFLLGFIVFLVTGVGWYALEYLRRGPAFLDLFFGSGLTRYAGPMHGAGAPPFWVEFPLLIGATIPWAGFLWHALKYGWNNKKEYKGVILLLLAWFTVAFGLALAIKWRVIRYLLPSLPPLAILTGRLIDGVWSDPVETGSAKAYKFAAIANIVMVLPVFLALIYYSFNQVDMDGQQLYLPVAMPFIIILMTGMILFSIFALLKKYRWAALLLVCFTFSSYLVLLGSVSRNIELINPWPRMTDRIKEERQAGDRVVYLEESHNPLIVYSLGMHTYNIKMEGLIAEINSGEFNHTGRAFILSNSKIDPGRLQERINRPVDIRQLETAPLGQSLWLVTLK